MHTNAGKTTNQSINLSHVVPPKIESSGKKTTLLTEEDIKKIETRKQEEIIFSWRFFDRQHKLFNMGKSDASWFISLIDGLRDISRLTVGEFRQQSERRGLRVHPHNWQRATARYSMPKEFLEQYEENCIQFSISKANGRVHGILIDNIFYIVWLDPYHNLYPPRERNRKVLEYPYPITQYEILEMEYDSLEKEVQSLKDELDTYEQLLKECN